MGGEAKSTKSANVVGAEGYSEEDVSSAGSEVKVGAKRSAADDTHHPENDDEALAVRRAYNRRCAAKARKRNKDLLHYLKTQVDALTHETAELKRANSVMHAQLEILEQQNRQLLLNQRNGPTGVTPGMVPEGTHVPPFATMIPLNAQGMAMATVGQPQQFVQLSAAPFALQNAAMPAMDGNGVPSMQAAPGAPGSGNTSQPFSSVFPTPMAPPSGEMMLFAAAPSNVGGGGVPMTLPVVAGAANNVGQAGRVAPAAEAPQESS